MSKQSLASRTGKVELSIIILNFNTKELLRDCLVSLKKVDNEANFEIIVSDNGSEDGSQDMIKKDFPYVVLVENNRNLGFAAGNNRAKEVTKGEFILFLNSDTEVPSGTISTALKYIEENKEVGALTVKTVLVLGKLDRDARRSFPTPWVALTHFSHIDRVFPDSALFSKYWYGYRSPEELQEVEVLQGAFFLTRKKILDEVGWFDEDYFLDGEDIDLCWKIKKRGWKIIYYPFVSILHVKKASKRKTKNLRVVLSGVKSMEVFYKKRLWKEYPVMVNLIVIFAIQLIKVVRIFKTILT